MPHSTRSGSKEKGVHELSIGVGPVVNNASAGVGIVMFALIADGPKGNSLDESTAGQQVEDLPHDLAGPCEIPRHGLAGRKAQTPLVGGLAIVAELEEINIGEMEISQVCQDGVRELKVIASGFRSCRNGSLVGN